MSTERRTQARPEVSPGIYIGVVKSHLDTGYMGSLEVEITKRTSSGNMLDYIVCEYASPFFGSTPNSGLSNNDDYPSTQKSYGFWAVPPDPGMRVIVVCPEGDVGRAYWIGCIPDKGMNFMTPGYSATSYNKEDNSKALPVGEYNKLTEEGAGGDPTKFLKPVNTTEKERLETAGLLDDHVRGTNTSSARREAPSMVFGMSTPGPVDRDGPKYSYGTPGTEANVPFNRLGGSSFVMDDGDMSLLRKTPPSGDEADKMEYASVEDGETDGNVKYPANDLVRIKTRAGHQILLHNTEDLIYISHGSGNSWIEMTGNGKIDVYAKDSISFRTENDINFYADRDINFEAKNNMNITTDASFLVHAAANWELKADADGKLQADGDTNIRAGGAHKETADGKIYMNSGNAAEGAATASVPVRIPAHEPWPDHEHLDPKNFIPDETVAKAPDERQGLLLNGTTDEIPEPPFPVIPDTFKKPT